ncbi:WG repeat-containing protein [Elizabethkingia anophelis]|uniref:WG repeat-containing protein n=2 Tax=Elizabethkingia anophelis TaxID=1117645 RepID=UPI001F25045C|nr:WG repeat-containing protein [Elizabethkingia anophelis]
MKIYLALVFLLFLKKKNMRNFYYFLFLSVFFSCTGQNNHPNITLNNIQDQINDSITGWTRIHLIKPNKYGYVDREKNVKISFIYDFINPFDNKGFAYIKRNAKSGYIDINNKEVIPAEYDYLSPEFSNDLVSANKRGNWGYLGRDGKVVVPFVYSYAEPYTNTGVSKVSKGKYFGVINKLGKEVVPIEYDDIVCTDTDLFFIAKRNKKWAFFTLEGKQKTEFIYDEVFYKSENRIKDQFFSNRIAAVRKGAKTFFVDDSFKNTFGMEFQKIAPFDINGKAIVKTEDKYRIINEQGKFILKPAYDTIYHYKVDNSNFSPKFSFYIATKGNSHVLLNHKLQKVAEQQNNWENFFSYKIKINNEDKIYIVYQLNENSGYGMVNESGKLMLPFVYDELELFNNQYFIAVKDDKYGVIDMEGKELYPFEYTSISRVNSENIPLYIFTEKDRAKLIDVNKKVYLSYEAIEQVFYDENKFIIKKGKYGVVSRQNKIIVPFIYDQISNWVEYGPERNHFVKKGSKYGMLNEHFRVCVPIIYDKLGYQLSGVIVVEKDGKQGIINMENHILCPLKYDEIFMNDYISMFQNTKQVIYARLGNNYYQIDIGGKILKKNIPKEKAMENRFVKTAI